MREAVTKVIDMLTQEYFYGAFQNQCIAAGGDYFEGDKSFMCVLSIKVPIWKKYGNLFKDPCILQLQPTGLYLIIVICLHTVICF